MLSKFLTFVQSAIWDQQFPLASFHALAFCSFNMASKICRKFLKAHGNSRLFFVSKIEPGNITYRKYSLIQNNPYIQFLNYSRPCRRFSSFNFQVRCSSTLSVRSIKGRIQSLSFGQNLQYGVQRYCTNTGKYNAESWDKIWQGWPDGYINNLIFASMAQMAAEFHDFLRQRFIELVYAVYKTN